MKVLHIEDDPDHARIIAKIFKDLRDVKIDWFDSLDDVTDDDYAVALLDLNLGKLRGIQTIETFKERFPKIPVVVLTSIHDSQIASLAMQHGVYQFFEKPDYSESKTIGIDLVAAMKNAADKMAKCNESDLLEIQNRLHEVGQQMDEMKRIIGEEDV